MAFRLPDSGTAESEIQTVLFASYLDSLDARISGVDCVLSGCAVTQQGSPNMTVAVAKGAILSNQVLLPVTAGNVTVTTADGTNPRLDLIVVNSSGTKAIRTGTPAALTATTPKPPSRSANDVVLAVVYVPAGATTITTARIYDLRPERTVGPIVIHKVTTPVSFNTTSSIQQYLAVVLPDGLFLTGRILRVRCGGSYLMSNGAPTVTLTIIFGTTVFADATIAHTADSDDGGWGLAFDMTALTSASQNVVGALNWQTPGAKTVSGTGVGDIGVTTHIAAPFAGLAATNCDTADRTLFVYFTMSVSNAGNSIDMDFATVELL